MNEPLAERVRPKSLEDYISQRHLVGEKGILTNHIKQKSSNKKKPRFNNRGF